MPGRDKTGPQGAGAGTGGRRGPCFKGAGEPHGAGRGFGASRRPGFGGQPQAEQSAQALKKRAEALERELEEVRSRIKNCSEQG